MIAYWIQLEDVSAMTEEEKKLLRIVDMHTAGEPVRIIDARHIALGGRNLLELRASFRDRFDHIRAAAMMEPRGHADMYGVVLTRPSSSESDAGAIFIHNSGYSSMCGHVSLALGRYLADHGSPKNGTCFRVECPCGIVELRPPQPNSRSTSFVNVPGRTVTEDAEIQIPDFGTVRFDVAYGGAYYAILLFSELGIGFGRTCLAEVHGTLTRFMVAARKGYAFSPLEHEELAHLYGAILIEGGGLTSDGVNRHICWFGEGQIDRSPTGSGVTARLALAASKGETRQGMAYSFAGASGLVFTGQITGQCNEGMITEICGESYYTSRQQLVLEDGDPLVQGFDPGAMLRTA